MTQDRHLETGILECWNSGIMGCGQRLGESNGIMGPVVKISIYWSAGAAFSRD